MAVTEGTAALPQDDNGVEQMGVLGPDGFLYFIKRNTSDGAILVDAGQSVMAAAADATGTDKHRWLAASAAAAVTGTQISTGVHCIYGYHAVNLHATTAIWVHYWDATSATGTPEASFYVPGGSVLDHPSIGAPIGGFSNLWVSASANFDGTGNPAAVPYVLTLWK